jgi:hypothetical protein
MCLHCCVCHAHSACNPVNIALPTSLLFFCHWWLLWSFHQWQEQSICEDSNKHTCEDANNIPLWHWWQP